LADWGKNPPEKTRKEENKYLETRIFLNLTGKLYNKFCSRVLNLDNENIPHSVAVSEKTFSARVAPGVFGARTGEGMGAEKDIPRRAGMDS
jgi:hypothetical protein